VNRETFTGRRGEERRRSRKPGEGPGKSTGRSGIHIHRGDERRGEERRGEETF